MSDLTIWTYADNSGRIYTNDDLPIFKNLVLKHNRRISRRELVAPFKKVLMRPLWTKL